MRAPAFKRLTCGVCLHFRPHPLNMPPEPHATFSHKGHHITLFVLPVTLVITGNRKSRGFNPNILIPKQDRLLLSEYGMMLLGSPEPPPRAPPHTWPCT